MSAPKFISFEGIDGSGKSTQITKVIEFFGSRGIPVFRTREPGGSCIGTAVRQCLLESKDQLLPLTQAFLLFADRYQHFHGVIQEKLTQDIWVITDRYHDSTLAYQTQEGADANFVRQIGEAIFPKPDRTYFLDIPPRLAIHRVESRGGGFEKNYFDAKAEKFYAGVAERYYKLIHEEPNRFCFVDASKSEDEVFSEIRSDLERFLNST